MANVLLGNLLAREKFGVVPWVTLIAAGYAAALYFSRASLLEMETLAAFRRILSLLGLSGLAFLGLTILFSWLARPPANEEGER
jgi:hypothetical protein